MSAYDWEADAKGSYELAIACKREAWLVENVPGVKAARVIGGQTLLQGDCLEIMPLLGPVDAVVTDPPYGIGYNPTRSQSSAASGRRKAQKKIAGDNQAFDPSQIVALDVPTILWGANYFASRLPDAGGWLVWDKRDGGALFRGFKMSDCELAWCNQGRMVRTISHKWCGHLRDSERDLYVHPTQKPVAVMEWCLGFLPDAETILDPFMGSGTTLVACQKLGRHGIGIELDPDYWAIACKRVEEAARQPDLFVAPQPKPQQEGFDL